MSCADENKKTEEGKVPSQTASDDSPALVALEKLKSGEGLNADEERMLTWCSLRLLFS